MTSIEIVSSYSKICQQAQDVFAFGKTLNLGFRKKQLKALLRMYEENESRFVEALASDLKKPKQESIILELNVLKDDVNYILERLDEWARPEKVPPTLVTIFDRTLIYHEPFGVVLIMGAWNYPLQLLLLPLSGAIAAGNCVILKPSEISPATGELISILIPQYLDQECYHVICGGISETTELLKEKFDYIFYTGSTHVGRLIRDCANKHLTPTTLELGGKSPVYIDDSVDMNIAVRRIIWGKCINAGQTCVAPDYVLSTKAVQEKFIAKAKEILKEWYGDNPQQSPDIGRIVSERHFSRLVKFLEDGKAAVGGCYDAVDRWIEPTILINVSPESRVMKEEIFGPILPMLTVDSAHEAIRFINDRPAPLSVYLFTSDYKLQAKVINGIRGGTVCINDVVVQLGIPGLPFGGVGESGMGAYHGKATFDTFTHRKSCLVRNYNKIADLIGAQRYPPYTEGKIKFLSQMLKERSFPSIKYLTYAFAFCLGALSFYAAQQIANNVGNDD